MHDELVIAMTPFLLILSRVGAFLVAAPKMIPPQGIGWTLPALSIAISQAIAWGWQQPLGGSLSAVTLLAELTMGLSMGLLVRMVGLAARMSGELLDNSAGFGFSHLYNPLSDDAAGPLENLADMLASVLFFVGGAHSYVVAQLAATFATIPPGGARLWWQQPQHLQHGITIMLQTSLCCAAPLLGTLLLAQGMLALLSKVAANMNIWNLGFAITVSSAIMGLYAFMPAWADRMLYIWQTAAASMLDQDIR